MPHYLVDLIVTVRVIADSHEEAEDRAPALAEAKITAYGLRALNVQPARETNE